MSRCLSLSFDGNALRDPRSGKGCVCQSGMGNAVCNPVARREKKRSQAGDQPTRLREIMTDERLAYPIETCVPHVEREDPPHTYLVGIVLHWLPEWHVVSHRWEVASRIA